MLVKGRSCVGAALVRITWEVVMARQERDKDESGRLPKVLLKVVDHYPENNIDSKQGWCLVVGF